MEKPVTREHKLSTSLLALLLLLPLAGQAAALSAYRAVYIVEQYNSEIARATYELKIDDNNYHFTQFTRLTGFAALFRDDTVMESSNIKLEADHWQVAAYSYQQNGSSRSRDTNFTIAWQATDDNSWQASISGIYASERFNATHQGETWDPLSVLLAVQRDFEPAQSEYRYEVINKGQLKTYVFELVGADSIVINDNRHESFELVREHGKRTTRIWLAGEKQHIPLRMEIYKDGKLSTRMDLVSFKQEP